MIRLLTLLMLLSLPVAVALPAAAQDRRALAEAYVMMPANQQMVDDVLSADAMAAGFVSSLPAGTSVTDQQRNQVGTILAAVMDDIRPQMEATMIEVAAETFTSDELAALIDFYSTEVGASVLIKMQPFMQNVMATMQPQIMQRTQAALSQIREIMERN